MPVRTNTYVGVAGWWGTMGIAEGCYTLMVMEVALVLVLVLVDRVLVTSHAVQSRSGGALWCSARHPGSL